ncbi:hypothetical protein GE115_04300 [Agromyces sp. CFH 90414]|uniref:DUF3558 domain-containing protein n=1 Tax=Agromyces agglutinans TaxID=2662258 RepID=A0A6I2F3F1_9MICO|nr:hypothetical protein [Agromyces agglutinans]MRG59092.1 hypothetical protein [Agromyces agglutinans]
MTPLHRRTLSTLLAASVLVALAACTASPGTSSSSASPKPSSATEASASQSPTADPSATPAPVAEPTCDTVLTEAEYADLAAEGLTYRPEPTFALGPVMEELVAVGALSCHWAKPNSDIGFWVVRLPEADSDWESRKQTLLVAGWTETDDPVPGTIVAPADYDANYIPAMIHANEATIFVSGAQFVTSLADVG